ncbi:heme efflux system permease HrtB [Lachnospiraceae bacterium KM106-2]|nr:heme efflux system permease HrtB [Lachnospiraceae bacterium KM106-2]
MKLAWKELKHNKTKYLLVETIVVLMIFMVLFLTGLASGLSRAVSSAIDNSKADYYVLSDGAQNMITISKLTKEQEKAVKKEAGKTAVLDIQRMNVVKENEKDKIDLTYFAIQPDEFLQPKIVEGNALQKKNEIVLNDTFQDEGIQLGDTIEDATTGEKLKVVGFTTDESYGHSPVGFITTETYTNIRKKINPMYEEEVHTVAVQGEWKKELDGVVAVDKQTVIQNIPGYSAEQTTLNMIIWVLVVVSAAILGVFFYVITIQKQRQFGVLKAIGMKMREITGIMISQTIILSCSGAIIGNGIVFAMAAILPSGMPFYLNISGMIVTTFVFILISIVCSLLSARQVAKVDPIITIGGRE